MTPDRAEGTKLGRVDIGTLILLALAACVYPTLLAAVILILARPQPLRLLITFLIGGFAVSVAAGIGIVNALQSSGALGKSAHATKPVVSIAAGAVSLLVAWGVWSGHIDPGARRRRRQQRRPAGGRRPSILTRALSRGSLTTAFLAGAALNLPGIWYFDALTEIAKAMPSTTSAFLQILLFNLIMFALVEVPIAAYLVDPGRAAALVANLSRWGHDNSRTIAVAVATMVGVWLLARGIVNLAS